MRLFMNYKLIRCPICECVNYDSGDEVICRRCDSKIYNHKKHSFEKTLAFLITAIIFYFIANTYPILVTEQFGVKEGSTIIEGVISLWENESYPIALVILVASVFVPIIKFLLIFYLLLGSKLKLYAKNIDKHKLFYITEVIGAWSMVDVFVVAILTALVQFTHVQIVPGAGISAFSAMVFFTMLSAHSFDIRLLWEK